MRVKRSAMGGPTVVPMKPKTLSSYHAAVKTAAEHIVSSLDHALDLADLARIAQVSPFHFHRMFRGMLGETPLELHRRLRLERAAFWLLNGQLQVTEIAFDAGYETHEAFTRAFRAAYGRSPSTYRNSSFMQPGCMEAGPTQLAARCGLHFEPAPTARNLQLRSGESSMDVDLVKLPRLRLAKCAHVGPYTRIAEAFERLGALAGPAGLLQPQTRMLAVYLDDQDAKPADELRSEACITVPEHVALPSGLTEGWLPAGRYARATHQGSYATLGDMWARLLGEWLPSSGWDVAATPGFEVYLNTPGHVKTEDLRTELYLPLA